MKQLFYVGISVYSALFLQLNVLPVGAQSIQPDSTLGQPVQPSGNEGVGRLKAALRRNVNSIQVADTLLGSARKLAYLPGQVVALCQLTSLRLQLQQPDQAELLVQEAKGIAVQIRDLREAGWAMSQVGRILNNTAKRYPSSIAVFTAVMDALDASMRISGAKLAKSRESVSLPPEATSPIERRMYDKRAYSTNLADNLTALPVQPYVPEVSRKPHTRPDFVDRWLDTLIRSGGSNSPMVQQITARKRLRDSNQELSKAFAREGDYAQAYRYYLQYSAYKDSLTAEATTRRLASLQYQQSLLKKEAQIKLLTKDQQLRDQEARRQQQFVLVLIGCIALLVAFTLLLTRNNRAKQLANRQLSEQKEALQLTLSQLKTTQTQLIQAEKMASLGELTAGIAHEIQNPLNFVNNFSEVSSELVTELIENRQSTVRDEELENELLGDVQQNLQKISQHGNRASVIIKGMLEHARPSGGQKERTDINLLTEEYLKLAYHGIRARDKSVEVKLTTGFDAGLSPVLVVPQEMGQVLLNLFNNAFYAVQKRKQNASSDYYPEVSVRTARVANQISIIIRDNGTGIPNAITQKIFQPFFTTKPAGQGTGLGLSLSYDIVTKGHGGTLTVESEEGEFTEFVLTLPAIF
ncbi:sensor histidine kinase [Spirosoma luteum]|uniref:sensor histidine kinase n=1 Tax=Spirosoma luteum TaxID=431553 RepID=UPI00037B9ED1|nr:ATP-binding protein [Spirosoma luteum]